MIASFIQLPRPGSGIGSGSLDNVQRDAICAPMRSEHSFSGTPYYCSRFLKTVDTYRVSVNSLFIFDIFEETLRSIVRSPISTTKPPLISGFTLQHVSLCSALYRHYALPWV